MLNNFQDLLSLVPGKLTVEGIPVVWQVYMYHYHHPVLCSWLYRIIPSAKHKPFVSIEQGNMSNNFDKWQPNPNQVWYRDNMHNWFDWLINSVEVEAIQVTRGR